jgi:predicted AlkP superfamily pyrophosphatase or phosphodiesterase
MFSAMTARLALLGLLTALAGCASGPASVQTTRVIAPRAPVTILISIDGFRPDYLKRGVTPNLNALAAKGATAVMRPSYPSVTFPNHYTLVTGLRPDRNGIVSNRFEDPGHPGITFTMASSEPFWWGQAEPIWTTAEKAGVRTATMFWPGSNVDHDGVRPHDWMQYAEDVAPRQRVDGIIDWLRRPAATRPQFLTLYFDGVDTAGHRFGPDGSGTTDAVRAVDGEIGRLSTELTALGQPANLVIVADHGMAATSPDRVIKFYQIASPADYRFIYGGAYAALEAVPGHEASLAAALLKPQPHMQCARKADLPAALHYGQNPRIPAFVCVVDSGWLAIGTPSPPDKPMTAGGAHGYDPASPDMAALFIASGPAIRAGITLPLFDNVDIYPLLARLIGVAPRAGDGDAATLASIVKP